MTQSKKLLKKELQAATWYLELQSAQEMTEDRRVDFLNWLGEDPSHEELLNNSELCWALLGELELTENNDMSELIDEAISQDHKVLPYKRIKPLWRLIFTHSAKKVAIACSLLFFVVFGLQMGAVDNSNNHRYQTSIGEKKTYTLPDGSIMTLNTSSEVHVDFSPQARRILMVDGEVLYEVAHDQERPFIVVAGAGEIRALGTKFTVRQQMAEVVVALLEGKVEVETISLSKNEKSVEIQTLQPGEQVKYSSVGLDKEVQKVNIDKIAEWSKGWLNFSNAKLRDVIDEVNRYTTSRLVIEDPKIQDELVSAYFNIESTDSLLFALKETYGIRYYLKSGRIYLYKPEQVFR